MVGLREVMMALVVAMVGSAAGAAERGERALGPFEAAAVEVRELSGELEVEVRQGGPIELVLRGPEKALDRIEVTTERGRLVIDAATASTSESTTRVGSLSVITGAGGRSEVTIGGNPAGGAEAMPIVARLAVPAGTALDVKGLVGDATIGDLEAPVRLDLVSGKVGIGRIGTASLGVTGSGEIDVAAVRDRLDANIAGSGAIVVEGGAVEAVAAQIQGAGKLRFGGSAERARVDIVGSGEVTLGEVRDRPEVNVVGAGDVRIANW